MESDIVIRHLEVRYVDLENNKVLSIFERSTATKRRITNIFLRKDPYLVSCSLFLTEYEESGLFYCPYNNI